MIRKTISRFSNMYRKFITVCKDKNRKNIFRIFIEFIVASFKTNSIATYYFTSFLYKRDITNYMDYMSYKEWKYNQRAIADDYTKSITGDKLYFHYYFEKLNFPLPRLLAYNVKEKLIFKDSSDWKSYEITTPESLANILKIILANSSNNSFFIKPTVGSEAHGVARVDSTSKKLSPEYISSFFKEILSGSYIFQDEVTQHNDLAKLNPTTLNTVRIDTFKEPGRKPEVISALLRIGRIDGYVDNISRGGCRIGIDIESGRLKKQGMTNLSSGALFCTHHPDSHVKFDNYQIPFFSELKSLAVAAANCFPKCLIGWDISISQEGPVLIEGNTVYYDIGLDVISGGYRKNPVYNKATDYIKNVLKNKVIDSHTGSLRMPQISQVSH